MYAIVNISGKQYKAEKGAKLCVPKQPLDEGKKLVLEDVLMVHDGKSSKFGNPNVIGAKVTATVLDHGRERKILVYKKKRRKGYQRKNGHRQGYSLLKVNKLQIPNTKKEQKNNSSKDTKKSLSKKSGAK